MNISQITPERDIVDHEARIKKSKCLKIVCVVVPNNGHMTPMSNIARGLKEKGHDVTFVSNGNKVGSQKVPKLLEPIGIKYQLTTDGPE